VTRSAAEPERSVLGAPLTSTGPGQGRAFLGVLGRDLAVTGKEFGSFISQVLVQPFFLLFVFGVVLGQLGYVTPGYAQLLLPGLLALNAFFVAVQASARW
jgi:ABC-2 type transport system permease protein